MTKAFMCLGLSLAFSLNICLGQTELQQDIKFRMTFDEKTIHYTALFNEADLSRLTPMDKSMLQRYSEERSVETQIDTNDDIYTEIRILNPWAPIGMIPIAKINIDKTGVRLYDQTGSQTLYQQEPPEYNSLLQLAGRFIANGNNFDFPSFSGISSLATQWESDGYSVQTLSGSKLMVQKDGHTVTWDFINRSTEEKLSESGILKQSIRRVFGLLPGGESVPVYQENIYYNMFPCGVCYKVVSTTHFSNYTLQRTLMQERGGAVSMPKQFTTGDLIVVKVAPNPVREQFAVRATFPEEGDAIIVLRDLHGRVVWQQDIHGTSDFSQIFNVRAVESGVYILELQQYKYRAQLRLLKI